MNTKLNSMRLLDQRGVAYEVHTFPESLHSAEAVADHLGKPRAQVYKTLVAIGDGGRPALAIVAGDRSLDVKKLALAIGAKGVRMAARAEAERLTGLRTGGISALALTHKPWPVRLDEAAAALPDGRVVVSAGRRGVNVELAVADLARVVGAVVADLSAAPS